MQLDDRVDSLKGVGTKMSETLARVGIVTLMDLILYFPRAYESILPLNEREISSEEKFALQATFVSGSRPVRTRTGKKLVTLQFDSPLGKVKALYFNMPYIGKSFQVGQVVQLYGKFKKQGSSLTVMSPKVLKDQPISGSKEGRQIMPRYALTEHLTENTLKKLIFQVLNQIKIRENLPKDLLAQYDFPTLDEAIRLIHAPQEEGFERALERLKFQELLAYAMKIQGAREKRALDDSGIAFPMSPNLKVFKESLPYELTKAQSRAIREMLLDQKSARPMNRLLQGDVGSGKTIVALTGLFNIVEAGYQGVLMVPTEILARQHFEECLAIFAPFNIPVILLTGSTKARDKAKILEEIAKGNPLVVVGTHALIESKVEFKKLGFIVTDEQHRFGVNQRLKLMDKASSADVLVMSATPIPRTLALHLYSDLDLSVIDEMPPGRTPVATSSYTRQSRQKAYKLAEAELAKGHQAYVVCPLIEAGDKEAASTSLGLVSVEELYEELSQGIFGTYKVAMMHGRMNAKEKAAIMAEFVQGKVDVLISTTVIEVGVNVPNATVMIVENAERFGLSSLHQLRGRVGRGQAASVCYLICASNSENSRARMRIMTATTNGFKIAEEDLKMRGTGNLFGTAQSGESGLVLANFLQDYNLFMEAVKWTKIIWTSKDQSHRELKEEILGKMDESFHLVCLN